MELTDGVITLRSPFEDDAPALATAVRDSHAELSAFMPWATPDYAASDALQWIRHEIDPTELGFVIVDPDGATIGTCGLNQFNEINRYANLGYWVRSDRTGRGYATRATVLLANHGLSELRLARVEILMSAENVASRRVAERAGAAYEGRLRRRLLLYGRFHDADLFSLVASGSINPS